MKHLLYLPRKSCRNLPGDYDARGERVSKTQIRQKWYWCCPWVLVGSTSVWRHSNKLQQVPQNFTRMKTWFRLRPSPEHPPGINTFLGVVRSPSPIRHMMVAVTILLTCKGKKRITDYTSDNVSVSIVTTFFTIRSDNCPRENVLSHACLLGICRYHKASVNNDYRWRVYRNYFSHLSCH